MTGIINYSAGNAPSVLSAVRKLGADASLISTSEELIAGGYSNLILPGVGAADTTIASLREIGILAPLENHVLNYKIPFLGICIGMQILFDHSEEGGAKCLGWLKGKVVKFDNSRVKVPQMGWNKTRFVKDTPITVKGNEDFFYFVNSYHAVPDNDSDIMSYTDYDGDFVSSVSSGNIYATQFHCEKSGEAGFRVLSKFIALGVE
ncbi:imidazole glycerol phosphate synthase subunit HisH [Clostridia bacterium]|nr:imidazole glycerol phosphate synthase subunit HisH [Clostridia bacterium]